MARKSVGLVVTSTIIGREGFRQAGHIPDVVNSVSTTATAAALADVVTDTGVLVADGALPTQAHVTTLDGHLTTLNSAWADLLAGTAGIPSNDDVVLSYNVATVGSRSVLRRAVARLLEAVEATNDLTA